MPFVKNDDRINRRGRPTLEEAVLTQPTNRKKKEKELVQLLRKLRPHVSDAVMQAVSIMKDKGAADSVRLKGAAFVLQSYHKLVMDTYSEEEESPDDVVDDVQPNGPIFSLRVVNDEKDL